MALPLPPAPGTSFLQGLENMQQRLQQSQLAMKQSELEKQRMAQQASQFQQQMGMRKQMMPYQIQALQDTHKQAEYARNPALQLQDMLQTLGQQNVPVQMPEPAQGSFPQMPGAQSQDLDIKQLAQNNPMIRGWYKKQFGVDPLEPTFQEKETIKAQAKSKAEATTGFMTQTQKSYQAFQGIIPELERLAHPDTFVPGVFSLSPGSKQKYLSKTNSLIEQLMTAMAYPKTNESIAKAEQMVTRGRGETVSDYKDRLRDTIEDLKKRQKLLGSSLEQKTAMPKSDNILRFNERGELI